ncbi:hypothetical protein IJG27_00845 [Candidatus Saccharibacteria bacterium]|nr:hypothetical protein [Candidatus Saccharibacteria bacterium]
MSKVKTRRLVLRLGFLIFVAVASLNTMVLNCMAGQFYPGGYDRCLATSGGRAHIWSVANYACVKATEKSQNACATWLGPADSSTSNIIVANTITGTVPVKLWGMCTDRSNTSSMMIIMQDGGSISCGGSCNFTRSGNWGSPSSKNATLDIAKFISGAMLTTVNGQRAYYRMIIVDRMHGGNTSMGVDFSPIYLVVGGEEPEPVPVPVADLCEAWKGEFSAYDSSNETHGESGVVMKIKNTNARFGGVGLGDWNDGPIYAMPTDTAAWHTCYYPGVETTANTEVSSVNGNNWGNYTKPLPDDTCIAMYTTNQYSVTYKPLWQAVGSGNWLNRFDVTGHALPEFLNAGTNNPGDTDIQERDNSKTTERGDSGKTFTENTNTQKPKEASISYSNETKQVNKCPCCPDPPEQECDENGENCEDVDCTETNDCWCCTNTYASDLASASVDFGSNTDTASVIVPYNFVNMTGVDIGTNLVYAGEHDFEMDQTWTYTTTRYNPVTLASYATRVPNAKIRLFAYVTSNPSSFSGGLRSSSNGCSVIGSAAKQCIAPESEKTMTLNGDESLGGDADRIWEHTIYNTFDASAGDYACFVSAVWPAEVNSDTTTDTSWPGAQWRYSTPSCATIAKRPSFQVWGSDMYSNATINAVPANKRNVYNAYRNNMGNFVKTGVGSLGETIYGSWVEEGLMLGGSADTENLASGAATGYNTDSNKAYAGNSASTNFDKDRSPLTISNYDGSSWNVGSSGITINLSNDQRREFIDYWVDGAGHTSASASGAIINYEKHNGDFSISGDTIPVKTTRLIEVNGKATITGNITYASSFTSASTLRDIPKLVIYADNVDIRCNVIKVDAIIITKEGGTVNTCSDAPSDESSSVRARQLKIFGMVITDNIILGRTYGSAAWDGSDGKKDAQRAAGEVFDFDSSILLWSEFMASAAETDTMQVVYQNEIAPRY